MSIEPPLNFNSARGNPVVAADGMVSLLDGAFTSERAITKGSDIVRGGWGVMFAGEDVTRVPPTLARIRSEIYGRHPLAPEDVAACVIKQYHLERIAKATEHHLSVYGLDMSQFISNGQTIFGDQGFGVMLERIQQVNVGFSLLVHGFDTGGAPHVFTVEHPGSPEFFGTGYWAIGSGAYMALSRLALREQQSNTSTEETIYNVCEAKVAAEVAIGVGTSTIVFAVEPNAPIRLSRDMETKVLTEAANRLRVPAGHALLNEIRQDFERQSTKQPADGVQTTQPVRKYPTRDRKGRPPSRGSRG